jgi:hypothetical protein
MNDRTKVIVGAIVGLFAISLIVRFVVLSQVGFTGGAIFYFVPIGGIVAVLLLLLRLGVINFGERSTPTVQHWQHNTAAPVPPPMSAPPVPAPQASQRLDELENLRTSGAISDTEYAARRAGIISGI